MPRTYYGYTRNRAKANLDALWAAIAESACGSTDPIALPDETAVMEPTYFGHSQFTRVCDLDALWAMLPGVQPAWPADHPTRIYRARASTKAYANLDALYAALRALDCCVDTPSPCVKILDESFDFADPAEFIARWDVHTTGGLGDYDVICDGETTQLLVKDIRPDPSIGGSYEAGFDGEVQTTPGAPCWMRFQAYFDVMPSWKYRLNNQQQVAFGMTNLVQQNEWFAFANDTYVGGPFYVSARFTGVLLGTDPGDPGYDHNGVRYGHSGGEVGYPPDPGPGAGVMGFYPEAYYDGFATLWELVVHTQYDPHGVVRMRAFIGPADGPKVPMCDARILAPGLEQVSGRLGWTVHSHKRGAEKLSPKIKRVEAWECAYAANPCGVDIVVPDPTGVPASLEIVTYVDGLELDDGEELLELVGVVARDADGVIVPGVRPEFTISNNVGADAFDSAWSQGVACYSGSQEFDLKAWFPDPAGGPGIESNAIHVKSIDYGTPRRFWKLKLDQPDNGIDLELARLEMLDGGVDVSGAGTPFGTVAAPGTSIPNAYDGSAVTTYKANAGRPQEQEIGIDFGPGGERYIDQFRITATAGAAGPVAWSSWSSMDGVVWMRHQQYSRYHWNAGEIVTFDLF